MGLKVATHYNNVARELNDKWRSLSVNLLTAFLPMDEEQAKLYNRNELVFRLLAQKQAINVKEHRQGFKNHTSATFEPSINIAHNYAGWKTTSARMYGTSERGPSARDGEIGIIPGSQGTTSYIVRGKET